MRQAVLHAENGLALIVEVPPERYGLAHFRMRRHATEEDAWYYDNPFLRQCVEQIIRSWHQECFTEDLAFTYHLELEERILFSIAKRAQDYRLLIKKIGRDQQQSYEQQYRIEESDTWSFLSQIKEFWVRSC